VDKIVGKKNCIDKVKNPTSSFLPANYACKNLFVAVIFVVFVFDNCFGGCDTIRRFCVAIRLCNSIDA